MLCVPYCKINIYGLKQDDFVSGFVTDFTGKVGLHVLPASLHVCVHVSAIFQGLMLAQPPYLQPRFTSLIAHLTISVQYCSSLKKN